MAIASAQPQLDSISKSIMNQMARAGQPKVTTTETETEIPDEGIDWGSMGLLLAMLLGGNTGGGDLSTAPIMGDPGGYYPGNATQGVAAAPGANPLAAILSKVTGATGATPGAGGTASMPAGGGNDRNQMILNLWKELMGK
jgi:hypothetical protein